VVLTPSRMHGPLRGCVAGTELRVRFVRAHAWMALASDTPKGRIVPGTRGFQPENCALPEIGVRRPSKLSSVRLAGRGLRPAGRSHSDMALFLRRPLAEFDAPLADSSRLS